VKYPDVKEENEEDSFEKFNFSHRNDYLDSEFSFNDDHKIGEKEKVVFKGLRQKYCFYPHAEEMCLPLRTKKISELPDLKHIKSGSISVSKSVSIMKKNVSVMSSNKDSGIFSKTGVNFSKAVKKTEKLPILKNIKSAIISINKLPTINTKKKEKESMKKVRQTLERILKAC